MLRGGLSAHRGLGSASVRFKLSWDWCSRTLEAWYCHLCRHSPNMVSVGSGSGGRLPAASSGHGGRSAHPAASQWRPARSAATKNIQALLSLISHILLPIRYSCPRPRAIATDDRWNGYSVWGQPWIGAQCGLQSWGGARMLRSIGRPKHPKEPRHSSSVCRENVTWHRSTPRQFVPLSRRSTSQYQASPL